MPLGAILILITATSCFALLAVTLWWTLKRQHAREHAAYELQLRVVQSSGGDLAALLESEAARKLLPLLSPDPRESAEARAAAQMVQSLRWGLVILCASAAVPIAAVFVPVSRDLIVACAVAGAAAVGLLLSAAIAARIARRRPE